MDEVVYYALFGAAVACACVFGAGWRRDRRRLSRLEDRLLEGSGGSRGADDLEERVEQLAMRVSQLARGQEFLQQFLSGHRRLPS